MYIYQSENWPDFYWDREKILSLLAKIKLSQGLLLGKMRNLGFDAQNNAALQTICEEILKSGIIEGELLNVRQVRSSVARRMGMPYEDIQIPQNVDGTAEIMFNAIQKYSEAVNKKRICLWHEKMFPGGRSGWNKIKSGDYRDDSLGAMQVVSGPIGNEKVCYQAPPASELPEQMKQLFVFINKSKEDNIIKAGISHLWFVILHPFDDGNGRIARIITELLLARSEKSASRFYSMSSQIAKERKEYYRQLEITGHGSLDITSWLCWFLSALGRAIKNSDNLLKNILAKAEFWKKHRGQNLNARQSKIINMLFEGFEGNLTSAKWAKICKCSHDTATRDIHELIKLGILAQHGAGCTTHYKLSE